MKQKTRKCVAKKVKVTAKKKIVRRHSNQNHFNAKETGKARRAKRRSQGMYSADEKNVLRAVPYL